MQSSPSSNTGPVIVVGQPRSGSTLLARLLNEDTGLFVINDFYVLQRIDAAGLWGPLNPDQAATIAAWVFERIEIRATEETGKTISQSIELSAPALAGLRADVAAMRFGAGAEWSDVLSRVMAAAAQRAGCARWGYNTPQDHLHLARIFAAFPDARVLFLLRRPQAVLSSYKNVSGPWHDARRYNPLTIGWAWRSAARNFRRWSTERPGQVMLLRYEDLVQSLPDALPRIEALLGIRFPAIDLAAFGRNSSHEARRPSKPVSGTELWLAEKVIGSELRDMDYDRRGRVAIGDAPRLMTLAVRSAAFLGRQMLFDRDRRRRAIAFVRRRA